jgi:hypothetical protein
LENFGRPLNGNCWYFIAIWCFRAVGLILGPWGIFCGHFGIFFPVLVCCTMKNLATL